MALATRLLTLACESASSRRPPFQSGQLAAMVSDWRSVASGQYSVS